jgi:hypothetical protein
VFTARKVEDRQEARWEELCCRYVLRVRPIEMQAKSRATAEWGMVVCTDRSLIRLRAVVCGGANRPRFESTV